MTDSERAEQEYALIVQSEGKPQQVLTRFLMMILNYRYGLDIIVAEKFVEAFSLQQKYRTSLRCAFVIQHKKIDSKSSIASLSMEGQVPLFLLLPGALIEEHKLMCHRLQNVFFCAWESAFGQGRSSLYNILSAAFEERGIGDLFAAIDHLPYQEAQERVERRFNNIKTLPTLPEVALHIVKMAQDERTTVESLEEVVTRDPAVVHKLLQVVNSPIFAGRGHKGGWNLHEAIVRLGRKKVGAIAQQIKLMNSLVKPEQSQFDLWRFWAHSVGCAMIADRLIQEKHVDPGAEIPFSDYWIASLLHDIGKLVLGFFFWHHFAEVLAQMKSAEQTFREAERELGDVANHEYLGRLLLMRSKVEEHLVEAVGAHDTPGRQPSPLTCLVHLANNLCRELGLGYIQAEKASYSPVALRALKLEEADVQRIREAMAQKLVAEVEEVVERCAES